MPVLGHKLWDYWRPTSQMKSNLLLVRMQLKLNKRKTVLKKVQQVCKQHGSFSPSEEIWRMVKILGGSAVDCIAEGFGTDLALESRSWVSFACGLELGTQPQVPHLWNCFCWWFSVWFLPVSEILLVFSCTNSWSVSSFLFSLKY